MEDTHHEEVIQEKRNWKAGMPQVVDLAHKLEEGWRNWNLEVVDSLNHNHRGQSLVAHNPDWFHMEEVDILY